MLNSLYNFDKLRIDLPDITVQNPAMDPTYTYDDLHTAHGPTFQPSEMHNQAEISYTSSVVYYPDPSIITADPAPTGKDELDVSNRQYCKTY